MVKKVALCGTHKDTLELAPFDDKTWEIWAPAHRYGNPRFKRIDVGFEVHIPEQIWEFMKEHGNSGQDYFDWLQKPDIPVYVRPDQLDGMRGCKAYPVAKAKKLMGREYFASTFSFMMCKAILDGVDEIGLYGINLTADEEYFYQRPNMEYLIGLAQGKGIKITIPEQSALLSLGYIYGDGTAVGVEDPFIGEYEKRAQSYETEVRRLNAEYEKVTEDFKKEVNQILGAQHECYEIIKAFKNIDRGGLKD